MLVKRPDYHLEQIPLAVDHAFVTAPFALSVLRASVVAFVDKSDED